MAFEFNLNTILQIITLVGVLFAVYHFFRKPQEKSEVIDAVFNERMTNYEKTTEKSVQLALNHSHTVESKLDAHIKESQDGNRTLIRIEALLEQHLKQ
jgi:predicted histidine transporter YuiF (NhaC family)